MKRLNGFDKFAIALVIVVVCMLLSACANTVNGLGMVFKGIGEDLSGGSNGTTEVRSKDIEDRKAYEEFLASTGRMPPR